MADLLAMCSECGKIRINDEWIGREHPDYQKEINAAEHITDSYCPKHLYNNQLRKKKIVS